MLNPNPAWSELWFVSFAPFQLLVNQWQLTEGDCCFSASSHSLQLHPQLGIVRLAIDEERVTPRLCSDR